MAPFDNLQCRLCLNKMYNMRNMILDPKSVDFDLSIPESIAAFFNVKVDKNDRYSKLICANCLAVIQLIHINRRRFQENQKCLIPLIKQENTVEEKDEDGPPVLEPYFGSRLPEEPNLTNRCENARNEIDYIKVPKDYFDQTKHPLITFKIEDKYLADLALYGESRAERKNKRMKKKYLKHFYNEGRPGVIRELIQDQARRNLYISAFDSDDRLKSIYEYDINLKPKEVKRYNDDDLWKVNMQMSVFVCSSCNKVCYSQFELDSHQKIHEKYQMKMNLFKVIF